MAVSLPPSFCLRQKSTSLVRERLGCAAGKRETPPSALRLSQPRQTPPEDARPSPSSEGGLRGGGCFGSGNRAEFRGAGGRGEIFLFFPVFLARLAAKKRRKAPIGEREIRQGGLRLRFCSVKEEDGSAIAALCSLCGGEIYRGEEHWQFGAVRVCPSCLEEYARREFAANRRGEEASR